jgi:hypothetical protein
MNFTTPMGGGISGSGQFAGYGGVLAALMRQYGQGMGQPQVQPEVDETELARLLGLIPQPQQPPSAQQLGGMGIGTRTAVASGGPIMGIARR